MTEVALITESMAGTCFLGVWVCPVICRISLAFESFSSGFTKLFRWHVVSSAMSDTGVETHPALADSSVGLGLVHARPRYGLMFPAGSQSSPSCEETQA